MSEQDEFEKWINKTYPGQFCYHHKTAANHMLKGWRGCEELYKAKIAAKDTEIAEQAAEIEALNAKVLALSPHGTCGCSYDKPGDICGHHSPLVQKQADVIQAMAEQISLRLRETAKKNASLRDFCLDLYHDNKERFEYGMSGELSELMLNFGLIDESVVLV